MGLKGPVVKQAASHYRAGRSPDRSKVKNPKSPAAICGSVRAKSLSNKRSTPALQSVLR
jgi:hypothetical protein